MTDGDARDEMLCFRILAVRGFFDFANRCYLAAHLVGIGGKGMAGEVQPQELLFPSEDDVRVVGRRGFQAQGYHGLCAEKITLASVVTLCRLVEAQELGHVFHKLRPSNAKRRERAALHEIFKRFFVQIADMDPREKVCHVAIWAAPRPLFHDCLHDVVADVFD